MKILKLCINFFLKKCPISCSYSVQNFVRVTGQNLPFLSFYRYFKNLTFYIQIVYTAFYCNFSVENIPYNAACTVYSSDDEHKMFETCRGQEGLNKNINLRSAICWLTLHYCITMQVQKQLNTSYYNPLIEFQQKVTKVDGLHVLVHLWHDIHQDLLSINMH
jgi:hypothetical protein